MEIEQLVALELGEAPIVFDDDEDIMEEVLISLPQEEVRHLSQDIPEQ
jgi:hypothetical protein